MHRRCMNIAIAVVLSCSLLPSAVAAQAGASTHLQVRVDADSTVSATALRKAELIANTQTRINHLEFRQAEARRSDIADVAAAVISFGASAYFATSGAKRAGLYAGLSAGAGVAFLFSARSDRGFDREDARQLAEQWRLLEELQRP